MAAITADTAGGMMARRLLPVALIVPVTLTGLTMMARNAGLVDETFGAAVQVIIAVAVFSAFIGRAAHLLHRVDCERRRVSEGLCSAHGELEARIAEQAAVEAELRQRASNATASWPMPCPRSSGPPGPTARWIT